MDSLVVTGLVRRYDGVPVNDGIDLTVRAGEVFGLLGPNGAGKTTLVRQLVGLLRPDAGRISLLGRPVDRRLVAGAVAYLPQADLAIADLSVRRALETTAVLRGLGRSGARAVTAAILDELGLQSLADRQVGRLSGGQRRLAAFATVLAGERPVLVLDEPTTGLDPTSRRAVWAAIERRRAERGASVVLVTHNVLEAETVLDRVAVLDAGRVLACDTPGRLKARFGDALRLELVWRDEPPLGDLLVDELAARAVVLGRRWQLRLPAEEARSALAALTSGPALRALDDFTLATPSLEDVYVSLGSSADLERV
ncbi:MAG TPA: ABC transporter ATP-binding protein [Mycobacteriales bacterium]